MSLLLSAKAETKRGVARLQLLLGEQSGLLTTSAGVHPVSAWQLLRQAAFPLLHCSSSASSRGNLLRPFVAAQVMSGFSYGCLRAVPVSVYCLYLAQDLLTSYKEDGR